MRLLEKDPTGLFDPAERLSRKNAFDAGLVMGVSRFTRATGRDRHLEHKLESLVDPRTGLLRRELAHDRPCPVCGDRWTEPLFIKRGFAHGRCPDCGLIYVNPVLSEAASRDYYQNEPSWTQVLDSGPQVRFDRLKYQYGLDVAAPYLSGPRLLDIGTGSGLFLKTAREKGFQPTGLELHQGNVARLRAEGFAVIDRPLEQAGLPGRHYDLISLWEVLEHMIDPKSLIEEIARIIKSAGVLLILAPNADALVTRILREKSGVFGGHSHVNFFNLKTITRLLNQCGFGVLEAETLITELGAINNYLSFEDPYLGQAEPMLDLLTPKFIHDRLLGSKLFLLARLRDDGGQDS